MQSEVQSQANEVAPGAEGGPSFDVTVLLVLFVILVGVAASNLWLRRRGSPSDDA